MKDFNSIIGNNLHKIRRQKQYSLDKVAQLSGVSKGMLAQIEKGTSNPTITILWKIATGLNVSFSYFMEESEEELIVISRSKTDPILEEEGMRVYPIFPYDEKRRFEMFSISLEPGCIHKSEAHAQGVEENVVVVQGKMVLLHEDRQIQLNEGDALRYRADVPHGYQNPAEEELIFQQIIFYAK